MEDVDIGKALNRTKGAIRDYRLRFGLRKGSKDLPSHVSRKVIEMRQLIAYCEASSSPYKIDLAKARLKKLSGLD